MVTEQRKTEGFRALMRQSCGRERRGKANFSRGGVDSGIYQTQEDFSKLEVSSIGISRLSIDSTLNE